MTARCLTGITVKRSTKLNPLGAQDRTERSDYDPEVREKSTVLDEKEVIFKLLCLFMDRGPPTRIYLSPAGDPWLRLYSAAMTGYRLLDIFEKLKSFRARASSFHFAKIMIPKP